MWIALTRLLLTPLLILSTASSHGLEADLAPRRHVVDIRAFGFHPKSISVAPGDVVVWINRDLVPHTATANTGKWDSGEMGESKSWEIVMRSTATWNYNCEYHPHMKGVVDVRARRNQK